MVAPQSALRAFPDDHPHVAGELCPYCDQPIPNDRAEEIRARFEEKERQHIDAMRAQLNEQLKRDRQQLEAATKAAIEKAQSESALLVEAVRAESVAQLATAREEGRKLAEVAAEERILSLTTANENLRAAATEMVSEAERQKAEAVNQFESLKTNFEGALSQRTQEVREAFERDKADAVNAAKAEQFEETLKLKTMVDNLQRRLDQRSAEELGEGAEVDLFESLKSEFPDDEIRRVGKGITGADIVQLVKHNQQVCGKVIYDSKNRKAWRDEYVTKLRTDQLAEKAEHAVLSTCKFPSGAHQLEIRDGVIIANPARVVMVAEILRTHLIQCHSLRVSGKERDGKTAALYSYITSERFWQHLASLDSCSGKMLEIDVSEKKAHDKVWENRGRTIKQLQRAHGELRADIERIIGTAEAEQQ